MLTVLWLIAVVAALTTLAYRGAKGSIWAATIALALAVHGFTAYCLVSCGSRSPWASCCWRRCCWSRPCVAR